jgi:hypothetical protein
MILEIFFYDFFSLFYVGKGEEENYLVVKYPVVGLAYEPSSVTELS